MRRCAAVGAVVLIAASWGGCTVSVCDDANKVCEADASTAADECTAAAECIASCVVEWDSCELDDPESDEAKCGAECPPTDEEG